MHTNRARNDLARATSVRRRVTAAAVSTLVIAAAIGTTARAAGPPPLPPTTAVIADDVIPGANGSTIGPDGALYVTASDTGQILRVDTTTGAASVYASGLPTRVAPIGGPMDLVFHEGTAYVLVSLVGDFFGTSDPTGIYRMDGPSDWTVIADLGQWALDNPPGDEIDYFIPTGVHYSIDTFRGGFVVAEAHHNKVLQVSLLGHISELHAFGNVVPTGLETWGHRVLVALAGPQPHLPEDGRIVSVSPGGTDVQQVAAGGPLLLDVERGRGATLFGLAQGDFPDGEPDGTPAQANTGQLLRSDGDGGFEVIVDGLDRPTSMEIVGNTAYVVGLSGDVVRVSGLASAPFGRR
jgi:hypothetical protein